MRKITYLLGLLAMFWQASKAYAEIGEGFTLTESMVTVSSDCDDDGNGNGYKAKLVDNNPATYWHSNWKGNQGNGKGDALPEWIIVDLGQPSDIGGIGYQSRQMNNANGNCTGYKIYASANPFTYTSEKDKATVSALKTDNTESTYVTHGTFTDNQKLQDVRFDKPVNARYLLFVVTASAGGSPNKYANCGEFKVYKYVDPSQTKQITYSYKLNGIEKKSVQVTQAIGTAIAPPALDVAYVKTTFTAGTVTSQTNTVEVTCTEELPFEKTENLSTPKWYAVDMHGNSFFWHYTADNNDIEMPLFGYDTKSFVNMDEGHMWCFKGNAFDGFEIYNMKAGNSKTLNVTSGNAQVTTGTATKWHLYVGSNGTCFKAEQGTKYLNHQVDTKTNKHWLGYWGDADNGSSCHFYKPADFCLTAVQQAKSIPANAVNGYSNVESLNTKEVEATPFDLAKAKSLATAFNALSNNIKLEPGLYRFVSANADYMNVQKVRKAMYLKNNTIRWTTLSMSDAGQVFEVEATANGKFVLKNANSESYMQGVAGALGAAKTGELTFEELGYGQFNLKFHNGTCHTQGHNAGQGTEGDLVNWGGGLNTASAWYIVKATDLEVALTTVGDAAYATAYLPFNVNAATDATLYIGEKSADGNTLKATSVTAVPAKTGVILKGAAGVQKATLSIVPAANVTAPLNNALTGTLLAKDYNNELVLGNSNNKIGFYSMTTGAKIGANKAFLPASQAAQGLVLSFDGEATGIESVMGTANENAPIFDLSGRRVVKTVKGGLYIQNGKKFIVR